MKAQFGVAAGLLGLALSGATDVRAQEPGGPSAGALRGLAVEVEGESHLVRQVRLEGLTTLTDDEVWSAIGGRPTGAFDFAVVTDILQRLEASESFGKIEPRLVVAGGEVSLRIRLREHPRVRSVSVTGLVEVSERSVVEEVLGLPTPEPSAVPWWAGTDEAQIRPGVLRGGLQAGLSRVMGALISGGRRMAGLEGRLSPAGDLVLTVEEGRIESVEIVGIVPSLDREVREALDLPPGRPFLEADVDAGLVRVRRAFPFITPDSQLRPVRAVPRVSVVEDQDGTQRASLVESPSVPTASAYETKDQNLTIHLRAKSSLRVGASGEDLLRHTPVAGFGLGVRLDLRYNDPRNRAHLDVETLFSTVDDEAPKDVTGDSAEYGLLARLRVPRLRIAELGIQGTGLMQTDDQWRTKRHTSYLGSLFFNTPQREYYWEESTGVFLTFQPARRTLLGVEYNEMRQKSVPSLAEPPSFSNEETPFPNPGIDDGKVGTILLRAEYQSDPIVAADLMGILRSGQESLVRRPRGFGMQTGFASLLTLEVSREGLGSDRNLEYTRLVSDSALFLASGPESGLRLRGRFTAGSDLPLQRQANLGGWGAVRGFDFKEFRGGDASALAMFEYRRRFLTGFVDVGALHRPDEGWTSPKAGAGLKLHIESLPYLGSWLRRWKNGPAIAVAAAWRLDSQIKAQPELLLQIGHLF